jgi:hypothetical protein
MLRKRCRPRKEGVMQKLGFLSADAAQAVQAKCPTETQVLRF